MKSKHFNTKLFPLRLVALPFIFAILLIRYNYNAIRQAWLVLRWGGEWVTYDDDSNARMQTIHDLLN